MIRFLIGLFVALLILKLANILVVSWWIVFLPILVMVIGGAILTFFGATILGISYKLINKYLGK